MHYPWISPQAVPVSYIADHDDLSDTVVPPLYPSRKVEFLQLISVNRKSVEMPSQSCCSVCSRKWVPELRPRALLVVAFGWGRKGSLQREVIEIPTNVPILLL